MKCGELNCKKDAVFVTIYDDLKIRKRIYSCDICLPAETRGVGTDWRYRTNYISNKKIISS